MIEEDDKGKELAQLIEALTTAEEMESDRRKQAKGEIDDIKRSIKTLADKINSGQVSLFPQEVKK